MLKYLPHTGFKIGHNVFWGRDTVIDVLPDGHLELGDHVSFTANVFVAATQAIRIGNDVLVAEFASLRDADHGMINGKLIRTQAMCSKPIMIGNDVWIGRGVSVLKGTKINDGAIVGANAVVTTDVPPNAVVAGVPARLIRYRS